VDNASSTAFNKKAMDINGRIMSHQFGDQENSTCNTFATLQSHKSLEVEWHHPAKPVDPIRGS
jgi:hypothetical protein